MTSRTGTTSTASSTDSRAPALRIKNRQFTLYILTFTFVASHRLVRFVERAQNFIFVLAIQTNVLVDWHRNLPHLLYITVEENEIQILTVSPNNLIFFKKISFHPSQNNSNFGGLFLPTSLLRIQVCCDGIQLGQDGGNLTHGRIHTEHKSKAIP